MSFERQQTVFAAALDLPIEQRERFLQDACGDDPELLAQVRALLAMDAALDGTTARRPLPGAATDFLAHLAQPDARIGMRIGPYELREALGRGGMGEVYRAVRVDGTVEQDVAIKFVHRHLLDETMLRRFALERRLLASLTHPHIARLIDAAALPDGSPYYVMEYVPGATITAYADAAHLDLRARVELMIKVCDAVAHAHRALIVHRDLKPSNILVSSDGVPRLLDFGIAKTLGPDVETTAAEHRAFSPQYAAPEQLAGEAIGTACDIYALGLLLYELLTGTTPFELDGLSAAQIERLITSVPPPLPSSVLMRASEPKRAVALRGDLDAIIMRCLRKAPGERYPSVEQLATDLGHYLDGRPVQASGGHAWYRLRKFVGRHRVPVAIAAAAGAALVTAAMLLVQKNVELTRERDRAQYAVDFMKSAFMSADPAMTAGGDVTARQILASVKPQLHALGAEQPELYVSLATTITEVEHAMFMMQEAADTAQRALEVAESSALPESATRRLAMLASAAYARVQRVDEARALIERVTPLGPADVEWNVSMARVLAANMRVKDSLPYLEKAVEASRHLPPTDALATEARWQLAEMLEGAGQWERALEVHDETLRWQAAVLPETHARRVISRLRRIDSLIELERLDEALAESQVILTGVKTAYGERSSLVARAENQYAMTLDRLGRSAEAFEHALLARDAAQMALGRDHPWTAMAAYNAADIATRAPEHMGQREALLREALDAAIRRRGPRHHYVAFFRIHLAYHLVDQGRPLESLEMTTTDVALGSVPLTNSGNRTGWAKIIRLAMEQLSCPSPTGPERARVEAACAAGKHAAEVLEATLPKKT